MITKQPTIEDVYNFDAFISTPGVRQGLLERSGDGDPELVTHETDDGPVVYYTAPHGEEIAVGRPIQLAMGGNAAGRHSDAPMSDIPMALLDMGAATVKGATQGFLGLPGDMESIAYGIKELFNRGADDSKLGAFIRGMQQKTIMPKTEEVKKWLDENVGQVNNGQNPYETMGEVVAPGGQLKAGAAVGRGALKAGKALAPTAGEMILKATEKTGVPVRGLGIVEPGVGGATKATAPVSDIGFYSAIEHSALNLKRNSGNGQAMLNDLMKGENVKADEIKWIGLDDFLKGKKNVTKQEVQDFIAQNKVDVQEVTLGGPQDFDANRLAQLESEYKALKDHPIDDPSFGQEKYDEMIRLMNIRDQSTTQTLYDSADQAMRSAQRAQRQGNNITAEKYFREAELLNTRAEKLDLEGQGMSNPPKFGKYQLPGGENYREILLTLPENFGAKPNKDGYTPLSAIGNSQFISNHWKEPNVLAHLRVNDRVDADGKKMLLIEEVQSDWHQAGRDKGYKVAPSEDDIKRVMDESIYMNRADAIDYLTNRNAVPDAPMKDTWYQLALKRALKYAADNGYDRVGLTTGARQAERYDLSKQVDELLFKKNPDGSYRLSAQTGGRGNLLGEAIPEDKLADYVGKEIAKSITEGSGKTVNLGGAGTVSQPKDEWKSLSGIDLQVGGEGMKQYYDQTYPQFLAKYGKKWGAKSGETYIPIYDKNTQKSGAEPIRYIDITPEMRESVGKGQPLFTATGIGAGTAGATMQDKEQK